MPFLEFESLSISFPGVKALDDVSFGAEPGSTHALVGENGAGKSTLLKILSGVYQPDSGSIRIGGQAVSCTNPYDALENGIAVIYQELHLVPEMSVAENICLGHTPAQYGWIDAKEQARIAEQLMSRVGIVMDPRAKVQTLSLAQRQMVEIAKALSRDAKVIAFDEPTSSLSAREVKRLFQIISELKSQGKAILYVSHRMDEIFEICDSATVLRDGKHVETFTDLTQIDANTIVNRMVGRSIDDIYGYRPRELKSGRVEMKGIMGAGLASPVDLSLQEGEIVGIFGLVGAGRSELLNCIYGATNCQGTISLDGEFARVIDPGSSIRRGIMLCPEDRKKDGIIAIRSVKENINISARKHFSVGGFLIQEKREVESAAHQVKQLRIRTPSLNHPIQLLSGGNQQKCILGRWLSEKVRFLLLDEPTRGIDVGAKREIYDLIYGLAESGVPILIVSSELPEIMGVCDRVLVMRQGRIVANIVRNEATADGILKLALPIAEAS